MWRSGQTLGARGSAEREGQSPRLRWWHHLLCAAPVVWDRRLGERRQQSRDVGRERRRGERRGPPRQDFSAVTTHLGAGSQWRGELRFRGGLRIDGDVAGPGIYGGVLIIGESARVQAPIAVDLLQVRGQIRGKIHARQRVEVRATGRVTGTIWAPRVELWPGAVFQGTCHLEDSPRAPAEQLEISRAVADRTR